MITRKQQQAAMFSRRQSHCTDLEAFPRRRLRNRQASISLSPKACHATLQAQHRDIPGITITPPTPTNSVSAREATRGQAIDRNFLHPPDHNRRRYRRSIRVWIRGVDGGRVAKWRGRRNAISGKSGKQEPGESPRSRLRDALLMCGA